MNDPKEVWVVVRHYFNQGDSHIVSRCERVFEDELTAYRHVGTLNGTVANSYWVVQVASMATN